MQRLCGGDFGAVAPGAVWHAVQVMSRWILCGAASMKSVATYGGYVTGIALPYGATSSASAWQLLHTRCCSSGIASLSPRLGLPGVPPWHAPKHELWPGRPTSTPFLI